MRILLFYVQTHKQKCSSTPALSRHNRWQESELLSGSKVTLDQVSEVSSIDRPGGKKKKKKRWRRGLFQYSLPSESPCVSTSKQLGAEDTEPFTTLWQYCNTWKQQHHSQAMTAGGGDAVTIWVTLSVDAQTLMDGTSKAIIFAEASNQHHWYRFTAQF